MLYVDPYMPYYLTMPQVVYDDMSIFVVNDIFGGDGGALVVDASASGFANDFTVSGDYYDGSSNHAVGATVGTPTADYTIFTRKTGDEYYGDSTFSEVFTRQKSTSQFSIYGSRGYYRGQTGNTSSLNAKGSINLGPIYGDLGEYIFYNSVLSNANRLLVQRNQSYWWNISDNRWNTPPLDSVGTAAGAYGLRCLRTAYAGSAIRVRRSSDNTEQDIGFINGDLDVASLLTFVGSGSGYVKTWYDQSGNSRNVTQTTTANQPVIVNAGTLVTANDKPAIQFNGTSQGLNYAGALLTGGTSRVYSFASVATLSGTGNRILAEQNDGSSTASKCAAFKCNNYVCGFSGSSNDLITLTPTSNLLFQATLVANNATASNIGLSLDGIVNAAAASGGTAAALNLGTSNFSIGYQAPSSSQYWSGTISELLVYDTNITAANVTTLSQNQTRYYAPATHSAYVTKWYDQSGNGNHLSQTNPLHQPELLSFGPAGKQDLPAIAFRREDSEDLTVPTGAFLKSTTGFPTNSDYTVSLAMYDMWRQSHETLLGDTTSTGSKNFHKGSPSGWPPPLVAAHNETDFITGPNSSYIPTNALFTFVNSTKAGTYTEWNTTATGTAASSVTSSAIVLGGHLPNTSLSSPSTSWYHGDIYEAIIFNKVLSASETSVVRRSAQSAFVLY